MKSTEGQVGRVFIIRLEDGDEMPGCIEAFAVEKGITHAYASLIGGIKSGEVVTGPRVSDAEKPEPMLLPIDGAHEAAAVGIMAPDEDGKPILHMHAAMGRGGSTLTGCIRPGVKTWVVGEVVLSEILGADAVRRPDAKTGFVLLQPGEKP